MESCRMTRAANPPTSCGTFLFKAAFRFNKVLDDEFQESFAKKTEGMLKVTPTTRVTKWVAESFWSKL